MSALLALRARIRFALWVALLRLQLRRRGMRLELRGRARFDGAPHITVTGTARGGALVLEFADGVRLGRDLHLDVEAGGENRLALGEGVYFMHAARVQLRRGVIALGRHTHVRDGALLRSAGELRLGEEVTVGAQVVLACVERIEIGSLSGLGERVSITDSDHTHDGSADRHYLGQPLRVTPVRLGRNVLVSANVVILRGADVGDGAAIAAGAVVGRGEHPAGHLLAGIPASARKALDPSGS